MTPIDWEGMKMVTPGWPPLRAWNYLIDVVHSLWLTSVSSGRTRTVFGTGTSIEIDFPTGSTPPAPVLHDYTIYDASVGATPKIRVTPGNHIDVTAGTGVTWVPTIGGAVINVATGGPPAAYPALTVGATDAIAWFAITVNPKDGTGATPAGAITAIEIDSGAAGSMPADSNTMSYQMVGNFTVTSGTAAKVAATGGGVSGSQVHRCCGGTSSYGLQ